LTTFHLIHIVVGAVLAGVNFWNILDPTTRAYFNAIIGLVVLAYNAYYLFGRNNIDVENKETGS
jgi:heme/copper-type cytochrome/quinol oxidase subunit 3